MIFFICFRICKCTVHIYYAINTYAQTVTIHLKLVLQQGVPKHHKKNKGWFSKNL